MQTTDFKVQSSKTYPVSLFPAVSVRAGQHMLSHLIAQCRNYKHWAPTNCFTKQASQYHL